MTHASHLPIQGGQILRYLSISPRIPREPSFTFNNHQNRMSRILELRTRTIHQYTRIQYCANPSFRGSSLVKYRKKQTSMQSKLAIILKEESNKIILIPEQNPFLSLHLILTRYTHFFRPTFIPLGHSNLFHDNHTLERGRTPSRPFSFFLLGNTLSSHDLFSGVFSMGNCCTL